MQEIEALTARIDSQELTLDDWRPCRDKLVALHSTAQTEAEYAALMVAHSKLLNAAKRVMPADRYEKVLAIHQGEQRHLLNVEALGNDELLNPARLEAVTRREVDAGRMAADDSFRQFAVAGAEVLGDTAARPKSKKSWWKS